MSARSIVRGQWPMAGVAWFPVHGPRQDGGITPGQVSCSEMESVLSYGEDIKPPSPSRVSFF